jgi:hypothetical protein
LAVGAGISLVVLGAILAFAVRKDASVVDLQIVGLIFMLAGAAIIAHYRRERRQRQIFTHVEQSAGSQPVHETVTHETVYEGDEPPPPPLHQPVHPPRAAPTHHPSHGYDGR